MLSIRRDIPLIGKEVYILYKAQSILSFLLNGNIHQHFATEKDGCRITGLPRAAPRFFVKHIQSHPGHAFATDASVIEADARIAQCPACGL